MRKIIILIVLSGASTFCLGQKKIKAGLGFSYVTTGYTSLEMIANSGVNIRADMPLSNRFRLVPWAIFYLQQEPLFREYEVNLDVHYLINIGPVFKLYPVIGLNVIHLHYSDEKGTHAGINLALGAEWQLPNRFTPLMEIKPDQYFGDIQFAVGLNYTLK